ncbi:FAD-dependent oxidoreductase [Kribbella sp. NPDC051587]|uniref:FAD-dependent oxidoreductase n=1 Tax=Kribbella sp. NPDC051587 TaxID=3364119 RepID=UPI00379F3DA1
MYTLDSYDVAVVGLGVIGSACLLELARRGWRVIGIEQSAASRVVGSSAGDVRMLESPTPVSAARAAAEKVSRVLWGRLEREAGKSLIQQTGSVTLSSGGRRCPADAASSSGAEELARLIPWARIEEGMEIVHDPHASLVRAEPAVHAMRRLGSRRGAKLCFDSTASLRRSPGVGGQYALEVGGSRLSAGTVLLCLGPWMAAAAGDELRDGLRIERVATHSLSTASVTSMPGDSPYVCWLGAGYEFAVIPVAEGARSRFGRFGLGPAESVSMAMRPIAPAELDVDLALLSRWAPDLAGIRQEIKTVTSAYTHTLNGEFRLRRLASRVHALTACSGRGFKFAPLLAQEVADILEDCPDAPRLVETQ